jgi:bifunctional non-homologous end joining protein LigD
MSLFRARPRLPTGVPDPCLPTSAKAPPSGPDWIHEIKHDGFRVLARLADAKVRLISRNGHDLTYRFPLIAGALAVLPVRSCVIDGEAILCDDNGLAVFKLLRNYRNGHAATLCAFDLIEMDGQDLRRQPIEDRKSLLRKLIKGSTPVLPSTGISTSKVRSSFITHVS